MRRFRDRAETGRLLAEQLRREEGELPETYPWGV
jgi:hypothetical protein